MFHPATISGRPIVAQEGLKVKCKVKNSGLYSSFNI
jgi:hypothetical protein